MATRRKRTQSSKPTVLAAAAPELVVVMRPQTAFRASAGRFMSAAGANVSDVGKLLAKYGATMKPDLRAHRGTCHRRRRAHGVACAGTDGGPVGVLPGRGSRGADGGVAGEARRASDSVEAAYVKPPVELPVHQRHGRGAGRAAAGDAGLHRAAGLPRSAARSGSMPAGRGRRPADAGATSASSTSRATGASRTKT